MSSRSQKDKRKLPKPVSPYAPPKKITTPGSPGGPHTPGAKAERARAIKGKAKKDS